MNEMHTLQVNGQEFALADAPARERLDSLEAGYRHIATYRNDTGEGEKQFEIAADEAGNPFACKEFLIFATFPATTNAQQVYIGSPLWSWIAFEPAGMIASAARSWRIRLWHMVNGFWGYDAVYSDATNPVQSNSGCKASIRTGTAFGETLSNLGFWAQGLFPNGTVVEIYGR